MVPHITIQKICKGGAELYSFAGFYPAAICFLRCFTRMTAFVFFGRPRKDFADFHALFQ